MKHRGHYCDGSCQDQVRMKWVDDLQCCTRCGGILSVQTFQVRIKLKQLLTIKRMAADADCNVLQYLDELLECNLYDRLQAHKDIFGSTPQPSSGKRVRAQDSEADAAAVPERETRIPEKLP